MEDYIENEVAIIWIKEEILFLEYKPNAVIDYHTAMRVVEDRIQMQKNMSYPVLCDIRNIVDVDREGRYCLADYGSVFVKALGIVTCQSISRSMVSYYIKMNKTEVPTEVFTDRSAALEFLKAFI
jgi:hypothetical protein